MEPEFWHKAWATGDTGWQQSEANEKLRECWGLLGLDRSANVLVPLCGSSIDMMWLRDQGHHVVGFELSRDAIEVFLSEHDIHHTVSQQGPYHVYSGDQITLYGGDIFEMRSASHPTIDAVYDRAATVALPPDLRSRYAKLLAEAISPQGKMLLVTLIYDQSQKEGPPFSIDDSEVARLFADEFNVAQLGGVTDLSDVVDLASRGLDKVEEAAYLLART